MGRYVGIAALVVAAACSKGDKCERAYDKFEAMAQGSAGKAKVADERAKVVERCKADLKDHPESEKTLDCMLAIKGELTRDQMVACKQAGQWKDSEPATVTGGAPDVTAALAKMVEYRDQMCSCKDATCAKAVSDQMNEWSAQMAKLPEPKMSEDEVGRTTDIGMKIGECLQRAMAVK